MREADLLKQCLQLLNLLRIPHWRQNQGGVQAENAAGKLRFVQFSGAKGISDIIGLVPPTGRLLAVECKCGRNKPTPDQAAFLEAINAAGGLGVVVYDVAELERVIREAKG